MSIVSMKDLKEALGCLKDGDGAELLDDPDLLRDIIKQAMKALKSAPPARDAEDLRAALIELRSASRPKRGMEDDFECALKQAEAALSPEAKGGGKS